jgi:hypothetical protein
VKPPKGGKLALSPEGMFGRIVLLSGAKEQSELAARAIGAYAQKTYFISLHMGGLLVDFRPCNNTFGVWNTAGRPGKRQVFLRRTHHPLSALLAAAH